MRFHRNIKMLRGQLDAAPFIMVFFLVLVFAMLGTMSYTPGVRLRLPVAEDMPGVAGPSVSVAVDTQGRLYFENQLVEETVLKQQLRQLAASTSEPLTLIIHADREVSYDTLVHVTQLARQANIQEALLETLPRLFSKDATPPAAGP